MSLVTAIALCLSSTAPGGDDESVSREQMLSVLSPLQQAIHDVEFRYEGNARRLKEIDIATIPEPFRPRDGGRSSVGTFQGTFALREDGAAHLDAYFRCADPAQPTRRDVHCLLGTKYSHRLLVPDRGGRVGPDSSQRGHIGGFVLPRSPIFLYLSPLVIAKLRSPDSIGYRFVGWEPVDDHRCAVIELFVPLDPSSEFHTTERYWIDLERGGHPIKSEWRSFDDSKAVIADIELLRFDAGDGNSIWFPIQARHTSVLDGVPNLEWTFAVLRGSIRFNQNLPDSRFDLDYQAKSPDGSPPRSREHLIASPPRRSRPEEAEVKMRELLRKADEQAEELSAGPEGRGHWLIRNSWVIGLICLGATSLALAAYMRWRPA